MTHQITVHFCGMVSNTNIASEAVTFVRILGATVEISDALLLARNARHFCTGYLTTHKQNFAGHFSVVLSRPPRPHC